MKHRKQPGAGIDLAAARKALAGLPERRLDSDWLAIDEAGHVAFFAGNELGAIPEAANTARVTEALDAIARAAGVRLSAGAATAVYRGFADRAQDPIYDAPCSSRGTPTHELPLDGYPLLMVASDAEHLRRVAGEWSARDAVARDGFAALFTPIGRTSYDELHHASSCGGCRVLDDPADPRPHAPEALAGAGLYAYVHTDENGAEPYRRVAGPTVPADIVDLEPVVQLVASLVKLPVLFENEPSLDPSLFLRCKA